MPLATPPTHLPDLAQPPAQPAGPSKRAVAIGGLATLLILGGGAWAGYELWQKSSADKQRLQQAAVKVAPVRKGTLRQVTRLEGVTVAKSFVNVLAPRLTMPESNRPMVLLRMKPNGTMVKQGDMVVEIDPQALLDHLDDTRDGYHNTQNLTAKKKVELDLAMTGLQQRLRVSKATLDKARLDLRTLEVRSAITAQTMRLAADEAEAAYKQLQTELPLLEQSQAADLRNVQIAEEMERLHVGRHHADLAKLSIRAPAEGMVVLSTTVRRGGDQVTITEGDTVTPGTLILQIVDRRSMIVDARANQAGIEKFQIGQKATIGFDAYPNAKFEGKVAAIGALATMPGRRDQYYVRTIPIQIAMDDMDERVIPDLTAYADIETGSADDALIAPASALVHEKDKTFVYVENRGNFEKREVKVGLANNTEVTILDGLGEGDHIRLN